MKLVNLKAEGKTIRIRAEGEYGRLQETSISGRPEWENSFEEPEKVAPVESMRELAGGQDAGAEYECALPGYTLTVLKFMK